jgi:hypothetical protein
MPKPTKDTDQPKKRRPPAKTFEARENQLIALAVDLAEKQLSAGTASAQVITHYLKQASTTERLEKEKLVNENELLKAKVEALRSSKRVDEMYSKALNAMRTYAGQLSENGDSDEQDD